ncbi:MAG: tRNA (adenosine(37)-N6)-threonylcarbamoyltransferase complex dimerization subunit type 1 TsaB [Clostridiales bacterium]|nr:tRNA (adenosine(37)-N6)-threonylcarbamoyltransferase complex dimerization subunit type 1 TsaB [Clostridiales bacterium]
MKILCINTAFSETYVAVLNENQVITKKMDSSLKQSENVLGAVDYCLNNANVNLNKLDAIACVIGPGSFTGIRIGASLVKGFCQALPHIKKIEVNSLDLMAYEYLLANKPNNEFWVVLNGLSGNLFACKYSANGKRLLEPMLCYGEELALIDGLVVGLECEKLEICNAYINFSCHGLLNFVNSKIENDEYSQDFIPIYLRKSQAEAELANKNSNN